MTHSTLIIYGTTDGHTKKIAEYIGDILTQQGHNIFLNSIHSSDIDITPYDTVIVGSSIRYGYHHPLIREFVEKNAEFLATKKNAFFSINLVARKPEKSTPETNPYARKFLSKIQWKPQLAAVFGGKLDYSIYGKLDAFMIRLIMRMTGWPLETPEPIEFTDWEKVKEFAEEVGRM